MDSDVGDSHTWVVASTGRLISGSVSVLGISWLPDGDIVRAVGRGHVRRDNAAVPVELSTDHDQL